MSIHTDQIRLIAQGVNASASADLIAIADALDGVTPTPVVAPPMVEWLPSAAADAPPDSSIDPVPAPEVVDPVAPVDAPAVVEEQAPAPVAEPAPVVPEEPAPAPIADAPAEPTV
jgi:hypothetical protein